MDFFDENKTPRDKFYEIIFNANKNLVIEELDKLIERMAALEIIASECVDDVDSKILDVRFNKSDELEDELNDIYIHTMSSILTKNE
jgi:hypothetical protein